MVTPGPRRTGPGPGLSRQMRAWTRSEPIQKGATFSLGPSKC